MDLDVHEKICVEAIKSWATQHGDEPFSCHALESVSLEMRNKKNKAVFTTTMELLKEKGLVTRTEQDRKPYMVKPKQKIMLIAVLEKAKTWVDEAAEAIEMYGHIWPSVNWDFELKKCQAGKDRDVWMHWFRRARLPALLHDRFFIDGLNRNGKEKSRVPPYCGWEGSPVDVLN